MLQDFTVFGGSLSSAHAKKICKVGHDIILLEINLQQEDSHFVTSIHFLCSFHLEAFISSIHFHKGFIIINDLNLGLTFDDIGCSSNWELSYLRDCCW